MSTRNIVNDAVRIAILGAAIPLTIASGVANAQEDLAEVVVTGTRISAPGVTSSSPILSVSAADIDQLQQPEVEKIFRQLPITLPSDGQNVNNGTGGAATISLRGLGSQRNLIMLDGKRMTPYSIGGAVDTQTIPTAMIERIDIITGGASAVYGSDAISGAINFITKRDFSGIAINTDFSQTGESDGKIKSTDILLGCEHGGRPWQHRARPQLLEPRRRAARRASARPARHRDRRRLGSHQLPKRRCADGSGRRLRWPELGRRGRLEHHDPDARFDRRWSGSRPVP
jgi:outer membrane receptor for Fe3+-dicitrate